MAGKPVKARQNGRGIWLYNAGIRQGSKDFFYFSDDYKIFALRDSKSLPLSEPSQRIQTSLCSADLLLLSSPQAAPAAAGPWILCRYLVTLSSENSSKKRANFFGIVANAAPFLSLMWGSPARHWQTWRVRFILGRRPWWNSTHRDRMSPLWWHVSLLSALAASFLFREQPRPSRRPPDFFLPGTFEEKAAGQRISAPGDEWAYAGCTPVYLTLYPQKAFSCSLHPPGPVSLCGYERSGGPQRDNQILVCTQLVLPTCLFFLRPHFGWRHGRKSLRQPASPGWVSGRASLMIDAITLAYSSLGQQCPMGVSAHSTRSIASSWAWSSGVSIAEICATAGCTLPSTFARFYNLEVPALQARVLST